jgi:hypothetical protein
MTSEFDAAGAARRRGVRLRQTALTVSARAGTPAARILPRIDRAAPLGVSCNVLLGGVRTTAQDGFLIRYCT